MRKSAVANRRKKIQSLKTKAREGKTKAEDLAEFTRSGAYVKYLLGEEKILEPIRSRADYLAQYQQFRSGPQETIARLEAEAASLPSTNGQKWNSFRHTKIGIIADEFLYESLKCAADFIPLTPGKFKDQIPDVEVVLIASAWRGLREEWLGLAQKGSYKRRLVEQQVIPLAKKLGKPVIFYSKEDPPNYDKFLSLASLADRVFTSAEEMIPKYREDLGPEVEIEAIRFAVNYELHNPLGCTRHPGRELIFAGSWMNHKYPQRARAAEKLFDGVLAADEELIIADRNLELDPEKFKNLERYNFPDRYVPHLHAPIEHRELQKIQKLLPLALNLNSVYSSQTMFANRVVELLGMGTTVLSNYSAGVNTLYPSVAILDSTDDVEQFLRTLTDEYIRYCQVEGIRAVYLHDTAFDRVDVLLNSVGIETPDDHHNIYVVAETPEAFSAFQASQATSASLTYLPSSKLGDIEGSEFGDLVLFLDQIELDGPDIVDDAICAFRYAAPDRLYISGFDSRDLAYEWLEEEQRHPHAVWLNAGESYSHAFSQGSTALRILTSAEVEPTVNSAPRSEKAEISVVVPVFNNGPHLIHKCFQSLYRSSIFPISRILLVDDGSTDSKTKGVLSLLERKHDNVQVFRFPEGGSGSASRPRNKGLDMAETDYVTYLDPDNEQVNDAFAVLLNKVKDTNCDFAIGNMIRFRDGRVTVHNAKYLRNAIAKAGGLTGENHDVLRALNFKPMSIQALVANTRWLKSLGLKQPEGAVGQDSYFFQQMLFYATRVEISSLPVHIYYAAISSSTVNSISANFYRKYLPLENARAEWLGRVGLLEDYKRTRFNPFLEHWYVEKLANVAIEDFDESVEIIRKIINIYGVDELANSETARIMQIVDESRPQVS